jgi:hypothetical protein
MRLTNYNESVQNVLKYGAGSFNSDKLKQDLEKNGLLTDFESVIRDGLKKAIVKNWVQYPEIFGIPG